MSRGTLVHCTRWTAGCIVFWKNPAQLHDPGAGNDTEIGHILAISENTGKIQGKFAKKPEITVDDTLWGVLIYFHLSADGSIFRAKTLATTRHLSIQVREAI